MVPDMELHMTVCDILIRLQNGEDVEIPDGPSAGQDPLPQPQLESQLSVEDPELAAALKLSMQVDITSMDFDIQQVEQTIDFNEIHSYQLETYKDEECPICMLDFEIGDEVITLQCFHTFHAVCIGDWAQRDKRCPVDMKEVFK